MGRWVLQDQKVRAAIIGAQNSDVYTVGVIDMGFGFGENENESRLKMYLTRLGSRNEIDLSTCRVVQFACSRGTETESRLTDLSLQIVYQ